MSEINEDNTEVTEAGNDAVPPENGSLEARARRMGWIDKEKFNGPEEMFVSAEEFIEKGENELPILRDRLRKQDSTIVDLDNNMKTLQNDLKYLKGATARAEKRGYEEGLAAARAKQREAVEEGDTYKFDTAQAEIDALTPPAEVAAEVPDRPMPREITEFTSRNKTWYGSDLEMTSFADEKFDGIVKQYPGYTLEQQLEERRHGDIVAGDGDAFALTQGEAHIVEQHHPIDGFGESLHHEDALA